MIIRIAKDNLRYRVLHAAEGRSAAGGADG